MTGRADRANSKSRERWHWLLYVVLALAGGLVTFAGARAQQKATDAATFRKLTDDFCAAWSTGNADAPARFYAKDDGLVFYDLAPFAYHGWREYHDGVQKEFFENMASGKLTRAKTSESSVMGCLRGPRSPCISPKKQRTVKLLKQMCGTRESGKSAARTGFSFTSIYPRR